MVKVSVCIQTYNHEPFIAEAIQSVLMQETTFDFEIIIGEDESQDGTREICIEYARRFPDDIRLFLRSRSNVIYVGGRPTGRYNFIENLKAARGKYIALLDGDDYWTDPLKLQKQVTCLEDNPNMAICFHNVIKRKDCAPQSGAAQLGPNQKKTWTLEDLLLRNFIPTCSTMFRAGLFPRFPDWFYNLPMADWPLHILNAQHGEIGYLDGVMGVYRIHQRGSWTKESALSRFESKVIFYRAMISHLDDRYRGQIIEGLAQWAEKTTSIIIEQEDGTCANSVYNNLRRILRSSQDLLGLSDANMQRILARCCLVGTMAAHRCGNRIEARRFFLLGLFTDVRLLRNRGFAKIGLKSVFGPLTHPLSFLLGASSTAVFALIRA